MAVTAWPLQAAKSSSDGSDYSQNLNRVFLSALSVAICIFPVIFILLTVTQHISIWMILISAGMFISVVAFISISGERNGFVLFLTIHLFIFYPFLLFCYALFNWKSPESDLYAPILSSAIAATALLGSIGGYYLCKLLSRVIGLPRQRPEMAPVDARAVGLMITLVCLPIFMLQLVNRESGLIISLSGMASPMLVLGITSYSIGRRAAFWRSFVLIAVGLVYFYISIATNNRNIFLFFGIVLACLYFAMMKRRSLFIEMPALFISFRFISALSALMLSARTLVGRESAGAYVFDAIFSVDFIKAIFGIRSIDDIAGGQYDELHRYDNYLLYMFDGRLGLFERLTQLPHMDIVVGRLPFPVQTNWSEIWNLIISSAPSVGQSKDIIYNDRLAWDTGLIIYGNVGHPLVTAAGELYAMSGFPGVALFFIFVVGVTLYFYEIACRIFPSKLAATVTFMSAIVFLVFSSTSVSALTVPLRYGPVLVIGFLAFARASKYIAPPRRGRSIPLYR